MRPVDRRRISSKDWAYFGAAKIRDARSFRARIYVVAIDNGTTIRLRARRDGADVSIVRTIDGSTSGCRIASTSGTFIAVVVAIEDLATRCDIAGFQSALVAVGRTIEGAEFACAALAIGQEGAHDIAAPTIIVVESYVQASSVNATGFGVGVVIKARRAFLETQA